MTDTSEPSSIAGSMSAKRRNAFMLLVLIDAMLFVVGVVLLAAAASHKFLPTWHDLLRDIGIACLVAAIVTSTYEIYTKVRFDLDRIDSILEAIYGSGVPLPIWNNIKATLLSRNKFRRNFIVRLNVTQPSNLPADQLQLDFMLEYDVVNLLDNPRDETITHRLDEHIVNASAHLPRFTELSVGDSDYRPTFEDWISSDKKVVVQSGRLTAHFALPGSRGEAAVPIAVRRLEVRSCPGSYYIVTSEIIESTKIHLEACPSNVLVLATIRPAREDFPLSEHPTLNIQAPLLPGHSLEFKFAFKEQSSIEQPGA